MATDDGAAAFREAVGSVVRALRSDYGWSLRRLSEQSGISVPYLSEIERGRKEPSGGMLAQLAAAFGMALPDLLGRVVAGLAGRPVAPEPAGLGAVLRRLRDAEACLDDAGMAALADYADYLRWRRERADGGPEQA